jgi:hypothetical protein
MTDEIEENKQYKYFYSYDNLISEFKNKLNNIKSNDRIVSIFDYTT